MALSSELIDQLVKVTQNTEPRDKDNTAYGTVVIMGSKKYVKIDGSDLMTPVSSTVAVENGDRVIVTIKSHSATVTGNTSSPAASDKKVNELGTKISDFEIVIADKVSAKELDVQIGRIDDLTADNATIKESLTANKASIDDLTAKNAEITGTLEANKAKIDDLDAKKLDTEVADIKYASVDSLDATDANLRNLKSDYAQFEKTTTGELEATNAKIDGLDTKYANVDFSNIGKAAIEQFYANSGIIKDLVVGDQTITGELVGITISGDLIKGNTIVADKLVIKGSDGLYYKLNTDGVTTEKEQTEYNSLNGQVIRAKSITATKIDVNDLVAFGATIGGFNIGQDSIFSGVKETVDNKSRGIYMDKNGQIAIGDVNNYIKYFKDTDGRYRLKISAASLEFNASGDSGEESKDLETVIKDINDKVDGIAKTNKGIGSITNYYLATSESSGVTTETAGWTTKIQNVSSSKKYLWNYEVTKYTDDTIANTTEPCIIGMYSEVGATGNGIQKITEYYALSALKDSVPTIWSENVPNLTATNKYMWNYEEILYTNGGTELTKKRIIGVYGDTGKDGAKGEDGYSPTATVSKNGDTTTITIVDKTGTHTQTVKDGTNGTPGKDGTNGKTTYFHVKYSNDGGKTFTSNSGETVGSYIGTCTNYTEADPTTVGSYVWAKIKGEKGDTGNNGKSIGSVINYYLATSASSGVSTTTSGWTTTVQNVTLENKYLWNYEVVKYSDGTVASTTSPCIIGTYGDTGKTGATGATGNGIKSIKEHYAVSTSNTVTPTSWLDDVPVTNPVNKYLWNYETITYTNGTSVDSKKRVIGVYGDTGKDGAKGEKGDDFRWNLVKGTNVASTAGWSTNGWSGSFDTLSKDDRTYKLVAHGGWRVARYVNLKEYIGQKVTISFYAKNVSAETTATSDYSLYVSNETGDNPYFSAQFKPNEAKPKQDVWEYYSYTIKTVNSDGQLGIGSACRPEGNGLKSTWLIKDLKIELGSPATPWSPHPDDLIGETGSSMLVLQTAYSYYQTDLDTYATAGYNGTWTIATSTGVKTGDTVYLKVKNATKNGDSYIIARVNSIQSSTSVNCTSIGLLDKGDIGATGADGKGIKSTAVTYQASTSGTLIPTGTWQTSIPTVSAGQYLWTRTVITYTDDSKSTSYSVGRMGTNGTNGSAGRGIKSTAITYQAGSSGTTAPTGTWQATVPATSASSPYLWTRTIITYTDDTTSTSYAVGSTLEGVSVGGRNLLPKTHKTAVTYKYPTGTNYCDPWKSVTTVPLNGDTYTLSFWAKSTVDGDKIIVHFYNPSNIISGKSSQGVTISYDSYGDGRCPFTLSTTLTKYWVTYKIPAGGNSTRIIIIPRLYGPDRGETEKGTGEITVQWEKLEEGNIATDWTPAPEDGIASVDVEYYLSTSATALSGGSWSTTAPTWVNGKYMWSRTVTTDGAGNKTYSPNQNGVCIAGAKGETGATGATGVAGKGVSSIIEQYYKSTSATALSGGSWGTTYPGWESGKYIWTRSVITYTDKTTTTTTAVCVTGTKGSTGNDGKTSYVHIAYANIAYICAENSSFTITSATVCRYGKQDKWVYKTLEAGTYTANSTLFGRDPVNGVIKEVNKITDFSITNSNGRAYMGQYTDFEQAGSNDISKYVWTKVQGAKGETGATGAKGETGATGAPGKDANQVVHSVAGNGNDNKYIEFATVKVIGYYVNYPTTFKISGREFETTDVQFSFNSVNNTDPGLYFLRATGGFNVWIYKKTTSTWGLVTKLNEAWGYMRVYNFQRGNDSISITWTDTRYASLPTGCIAADQLQAAKTATNFMEFNSGTGLQIGDKTNGSWKGFRSRITSTAFEILNEAGSAVASYGRKLIQLGKDSADAVIELCGGRGKISFTNRQSSTSWSSDKDLDDLTLTSESIRLDSHDIALNTTNEGILESIAEDKTAHAYTRLWSSIDNQSVRPDAGFSVTVDSYYNQIISRFQMESEAFAKTTGITLQSAYADGRGKSGKVEITPDAIQMSASSSKNCTFKVTQDGAYINNVAIPTDMNDRIVAQGTSGIWRYRKFASGVAECWGNIQHTTMTNVHEAQCYQWVGFPFTFKSISTITCGSWSPAVIANYGSVYVCTRNVQMGGCQIGASAKSGLGGLYASIHVMGTWK